MVWPDAPIGSVDAAVDGGAATSTVSGSRISGAPSWASSDSTSACSPTSSPARAAMRAIRSSAGTSSAARNSSLIFAYRDDISAGQLAAEPGRDHRPLGLDGALGHAEHLGDLGD